MREWAATEAAIARIKTKGKDGVNKHRQQVE